MMWKTKEINYHYRKLPYLLAECDKEWVRELGALFEMGGRGRGGC